MFWRISCHFGVFGRASDHCGAARRPLLEHAGADTPTLGRDIASNRPRGEDDAAAGRRHDLPHALHEGVSAAEGLETPP